MDGHGWSLSGWGKLLSRDIMQSPRAHGKAVSAKSALHVASSPFSSLRYWLPAAAHAAALDGATLSWPWALPFAGILLTIALAPLVFRRVWHHHYGKFAFAWAVLTLAPLAALRGVDTALAALAHALLGDYLGFIAILFALYVVAGGILVAGTVRGTPLVNALRSCSARSLPAPSVPPARR